MRFEELSKKHQDFLMYSLSDFIKSKVKREERDQVSTSKSPSRYVWQNRNQPVRKLIMQPVGI